MLQVADTPRLWITNQQLNEHMTERNNIKTPGTHKSAFLTLINPPKAILVWHRVALFGQAACREVHR